MVEILSAPSYPLREEAGLVSPRFFFLREFLSRALQSERVEQAILKVMKKIEQWKYILYHSNNNVQMMLYNAQMTT